MTTSCLLPSETLNSMLTTSMTKLHTNLNVNSDVPVKYQFKKLDSYHRFLRFLRELFFSPDYNHIPRTQGQLLYYETMVSPYWFWTWIHLSTS